MTVQFSYPGVYIRELPAAGPIEGVGTSTAAFLGPARNGEPNAPVRVTSFDEFRQRFGDQPASGSYLWFAVRGFFENGGQSAYIVRVSNGTYARAELDDSRTPGTAQPALVIRSRQLGASGINVTVSHSSYVTTTAFRPQPAPIVTATAGSSAVVVGVQGNLTAPQVAAQFRVGDRVRTDMGVNNETALIRRVTGATLVIDHPLSATYDGGTVRLDDLQAGDDVVRVQESQVSGNVLARASVITLQQGTSGPETAIVASVETERIRPRLTTYRLTLEDALTGGPYSRDTAVSADINILSQEFDLTVNGRLIGEHLSMARGNPRYYSTVLASQPSSLVVVEEPETPSTATLPLLRPAAVTAQPLSPGTADTPDSLMATHYQNALDALREVDGANFVAMPDSMKLSDTEREAAQLALLAHCTEMADRFAIFDPPATANRDNIENIVDLLRSERGFGALYFPWIRVSHPAGGTYPIPPSGHVAGVYARADTEQGVHKAPANYTLNGSLGVAVDMNNEQQGVLNLAGINVLRVFPDSRRPVVWGARTTSNNTAWQYINIRRLLLFIEESLEAGLRWAVFEPNNLQLWQKIRRTITDFLTNIWRSGALFGATAEDAFYVRVDETNNPDSERQLGRLHIEIGIRPVYPAEFIVVQIGLWEGGAEIDES